MKFNIKSTIIAGIILIAGFSACKSIPPRNPASPDSSVLAGSVRVSQFIGSKTASKVYLIRMDKKGNATQKLTGKTTIYETNWTDKGYSYLLDAEPGDYVVVAFEYIVEDNSPPSSSSTTSKSGKVTVTTSTGGGGGTLFTVFLDKETIEKTRTTVVPGKIAFIGDLYVGYNTDYEKADDVQKHYANILRPGALDNTGTFGKLFATTLLSELKSFGRDGKIKEEFEESSKKTFTETTWEFIIK